MIQEIILIFGVIYIIVWLFYQDSVPEFRINQLEWSNRTTIPVILPEKLPIVLRDIPPLNIWTHDDVIHRQIYSTVPVFQGQTISQWLSQSIDKQLINSPWTLQHARMLGNQSGIETWSRKWLHELMYPPYASFIGCPKYSCWIGARTIWKSCAPWTVILPTEGEIVVSIMPVKGYSHALPIYPENHWLPRITKFDTPFAGDLKFIDIRLRPGHILMIPAHWYISWEESELDYKGLEEYGLKGPPMICLLEYHNIFTITEDWKMLKSSRLHRLENVKQRTGPVISYEENTSAALPTERPRESRDFSNNRKPYREFQDSDDEY